MTTTKPTYRPAAFHSLFAAHRSQTEKHAFSSKERDVETGLSYFGARYYSSDLSIWLSVDPMVDYYLEISPYIYCNNNPLSLIDPYGEEFSDFMSRLSDDPPQHSTLPTDEKCPHELPEVVIKTTPNSSSTRDNTSSNKKSKANAIILTFPIVIESVFERIHVIVVASVIPVISMLPFLLQGDCSPSQYEKSNGKNEPHGDNGRALGKAEKQIKNLEMQLQNAKNNKERQKIKEKIKHIRQDAEKKQRGESHSNGNKR